MILAGDIGGTHTRLAIFEGRKKIREEKFSSKKYNQLIDIVKAFLHNGERIQRAVFGVAGPVKDGKCQATNLPWFIDAEEIKAYTRISEVFLINDLLANAYGIRALKEDEITLLNPGKKAHGNACLIAAGTGLGEAGFYWDGKEHHPFACEGGHTDFAPANHLQMELWQYMHAKYGHVSYERIVSGPGIGDLYHFFRDVKKEPPLTGDVTDLSRTISSRAMEKTSPICEKVMHLFISIYGAETGNLALKMLATGGVYIGGGIAPEILPILKDGPFMESFLAKGRFQELLRDMPIRVILNEDTALLGSLEFALKI